MADAISAALLLVETAIISIDQIHSRTSSVRKDLERARNCLARLQQWDAGNSNPQARDNQVQDLAYYIEDAINEYMLQVPQHSHTHPVTKLAHKFVHFIPDQKASSNLSSSRGGGSELKFLAPPLSSSIDYLEQSLKLLTLLDSVHSDGSQEGRPSSSTGPQGGTLNHTVLEDHEIVGYDEEKKRLFQHLRETNPELLTIVIVGPGGSGKTTLVKNVYQSQGVRSLFDFHVWIDVPPNVDQLLPKLLRSFEPRRQEVVPHEDISDDQAKLRQILGDKKFLVVLDNVWSNEAFKSIVNALPKAGGSKLIGITRNIDVAPVSSRYTYTHNLSAGLSPKKANQLFCKKAFPDVEGNLCPADLEDWAEKIIKRCEGLPWAISQIGTLLATTPRIAVEWKKMHDTLGSDLSVASISSYRDLPSNIIQCFLYFGMFPEDETISRERLIRLWVAEGFVRPDDRVRTVEEVAESILTDLINRNLVVVSARDIDGRVKNCRVSNIVREFIISNATHFITVLEANSVQNIVRNSSQKIRRLSVQCDINLLRGINKSRITHTRSLLVFRQTANRPELDMVLKACKHLQVLGLQGVPDLVHFPESVISLALLRYVSLRQTKIKNVPKSIKKLGVLETLELKDTLVTNLPKGIAKLHHLRHLLVYRNAVNNNMTFGAAQGVEFSTSRVSALSISNSLQKLSLIKINTNQKFLKALEELKDLRRLGLVDLNRENGKDLCNAIQKMENLSTLDVRATSEDEYLELDHMQSGSPPLLLQHLYLKGRLKRVPQWIPDLTSLKKIGLKWSKMDAEPLEALQDLPNLMELDLVDYYTGQELCFRLETFKKLVALSIDKFDKLHLISIGKKAMPMLKKLTISRCQNLKLLPVFLSGDLELLEELLLFDMPNEFIAEFETYSERREDLRHVGVIHYSRHPGSNQSDGFKDLSPSKWR